MLQRKNTSRTKDQAVAVCFRLFLGGLVIIRILSCLSASDWDERRDGPPSQELLAKIDAFSAKVESTELTRRTYDITHDPALPHGNQGQLPKPSRKPLTKCCTGSVIDNPGRLQQVTTLEPIVRNWVEPRCPRRAMREFTQPPEIAAILDAIRAKEVYISPVTAEALAEQAMSSRLVSLSLTMTELAVLVAGNWAFHRFMRGRRTAEEILRRKEQFARSTVDALPTHIAILDSYGIILAVNRAWREFADANGGDPERVCEGANYLIVCDSADGHHCSEAQAFGLGIRAVMAGKQEEFAIEYAAHSRTERRWFVGRVTRFPGIEGQQDGKFVSAPCHLP